MWKYKIVIVKCLQLNLQAKGLICKPIQKSVEKYKIGSKDKNFGVFLLRKFLTFKFFRLYS